MTSPSLPAISTETPRSSPASLASSADPGPPAAGSLLTVRGWLSFLLCPRVPLWRYCLTLYPMAFCGSFGLFAGVYGLLRLAGLGAVSPIHQSPTARGIIGAVVFSPVVETLILGGGLRLLSDRISRPVRVALVSALLWGTFHALLAPLWFFGTVWSFFLMSCAFLGWRKWSYGRAFIAACVPHVLINLTGTLLLLFGKS